ncbi:hypothetical protein [Streptomyces sp. NRRL F-5126]|uniref:hypothetical protein n=1 Tax=Streptomyces sp. NRRL F-5126 TaxID=1463857 RepID=UPI0004C73237|nr:hypothetical protein [Streptomyces sp. NRRL F-5126]
MRKIATAAAGLSLAMGALGLAVAPSAEAATPCPSGAVCIRETNGTILNRNIFYSYGAHNLSNVIGKRVIVNNQTGNAGFKLCRGYNGGSPCTDVERYRGSYEPYNMTPINSVVLVK